MRPFARRSLFAKGLAAAGVIAAAPAVVALAAAPVGAASGVPHEGLTAVPDWAHSHNRPGSGSLVIEFFRVIAGPPQQAGRYSARVLAYNGAALVRTDGHAFGIPYMDVVGLAYPVVGVAATNDVQRIILLLEDGDCVHVGTPH